MTLTETTLRKLSTDEVAIYCEQGYVIVPDVFPLEELAEIDREIDRLQETQKNTGRNKGWIMQLGLRSEITRQFAQDERVLTLIEDIVKPGISIYSGKLTAKVPHSNDICHWAPGRRVLQHARPEQNAHVHLDTATGCR